MWSTQDPGKADRRKRDSQSKEAHAEMAHLGLSTLLDSIQETSYLLQRGLTVQATPVAQDVLKHAGT